MGPKRSGSKSRSPKPKSVEKQRADAKDYIAKMYGEKVESPPVGSKRKAAPAEAKGKAKAPKRSASKDKKAAVSVPIRASKRGKGTGTPVMSEDDDEDEDEDMDEEDEEVEKVPSPRPRGRSRGKSTDKAPSPSVAAAQKSAQEYASKTFGKKESPGKSKSPVRQARKPPAARERSTSPYAGMAAGGSSEKEKPKSALPPASQRQRSDRRRGGGPFSVEMPAVPTSGDYDADSVPPRGRHSLSHSPPASPRGRSVSATPATSSPRVSYNPDEDPWFVQHIDGIAVGGITLVLVYCFFFMGGEGASFASFPDTRSYSVDELKAMAELKKSQTMYMLVISVFFPLVYLASSGGWLNYAMALVFSEKEEAPAPAAAAAAAAAAAETAPPSTGRGGRSLSPVRAPSRYGLDGRLVGRGKTGGASSSSSSSSTAAAAAPNAKAKASWLGALVTSVRLAWDNLTIVGIACATVSAVLTVALYPSKHALYSGLLTLVLVLVLVLVTRHRSHAAQQGLIDGLTRLAKDALRTGHRNGPFPVSYLLEELLEQAQDGKLPAGAPAEVRALSLAQIKALWPAVKEAVLTDTRVQQATMDYQGAQKMLCWKFAGASDSLSPGPGANGGWTMGFGSTSSRGTRANSPFVARASTGTAR